MKEEEALRKLEDLVKQKEKGEISEEEYSKEALSIINEEVNRPKRYINRDKQLDYLCQSMTSVLSHLQVIVTANAYMYDKIMGGRHSSNWKMLNKSIMDFDKHFFDSMINRVSDGEFSKGNVDAFLAKAEELLGLKFECDETQIVDEEPEDNQNN